jgi:hypothetical protein
MICSLSWVTYCFSSFVDIQGRMIGCDFLDLGDRVGLSPSLGTRGGLCRMWLPQRWNLSVNILWARKHCEKLCGDLLAVHQRRRMLGKIETFSHLASNKITNIWVKLCNLYSKNCHDSHAHGYERHEPFTWLVGYGWVGSIGFESSWFGSWYAAGAKPVCMIFGFGYKWDACERWSILVIGVTHVSLRPLITMGNLGAWSCLDVV